MSTKYRCVSFCVTKLTRSQKSSASLCSFLNQRTLEQPSNTSLLQSVLNQVLGNSFVWKGINVSISSID